MANGMINIPNNVWHKRGCTMVAWIETNFPDSYYYIRFKKNFYGDVVYGKPIQIEFDTAEAATLFKLTWGEYFI